MFDEPVADTLDPGTLSSGALDAVLFLAAMLIWLAYCQGVALLGMLRIGKAHAGLGLAR